MLQAPAPARSSRPALWHRFCMRDNALAARRRGGDFIANAMVGS
jgi:hypothetical protein